MRALSAPTRLCSPETMRSKPLCADRSGAMACSAQDKTQASGKAGSAKPMAAAAVND